MKIWCVEFLFVTGALFEQHFATTSMCLIKNIMVFVYMNLFFYILNHACSQRSTWQKGENNEICDEGFGGTQSIVMMQCVFHCLICLRIFCIMQSMSPALFMPIMWVCPKRSLIRCWLRKHTHQGVMFGGRVRLDSYVRCRGLTTNKFWVLLLMHPPCTSPQQRGLLWFRWLR